MELDSMIVGAQRFDDRATSLRRFLFVESPSRRRHAGARRYAQSHSVKPTADRFAIANRSRSAHQDQEDGLERVFGFVRICKRSTADAEHHGPVALGQSSERKLGGLAAAGDEPVQKLPISQTSHRAGLKHGVQMPENGLLQSSHGAPPPLS
jgi:hypothetical protein